ncbi:MAG: hypothetical protein ABIF77_22290 [bacterium]
MFDLSCPFTTLTIMSRAKDGSVRTVLILLALGLGVLLPYGLPYVFLIRYFLMWMLFQSSVDLVLQRDSIKGSHLAILAVNIGLPVALFLGLRSWLPTEAMVLSVTAMAPTAVAAPVVIELLRGKTAYAAASLLLTNLVMAGMIPLLISRFGFTDSSQSLGAALPVILSVILIPLGLAQLVRIRWPRLAGRLARYRRLSFYLLVCCIYLGTTRATHFVRHEIDAPLILIARIAAATLVMCVLGFLLGRYLGGRQYAREASFSLGHKNNAFTIWIALTFVSPLAALGPVCYVLFQNVYLSYCLSRDQQ